MVYPESGLRIGFGKSPAFLSWNRGQVRAERPEMNVSPYSLTGVRRIMAEKKIEQSKGKYTELELRTRGIGKFHDTRTEEWATKLSTYHDEEVKRAYLAIKRSLALLCTDVDGFQYHEIAHQAAQVILDKYLLQRSKGQDVPIPGPVVSESSLQSAPKVKQGKGILKATATKADFAKWDGKIDTVSDINWIYNIVKDAVRQIKKTFKEVFMPLSQRPGEAQVDFGHAQANFGATLKKIVFFVMSIAHSDAMFVNHPRSYCSALVR